MWKINFISFYTVYLLSWPLNQASSTHSTSKYHTLLHKITYYHHIHIIQTNRTVENIGARRLHTVIERIVEEISFDAPDKAGQSFVIDEVRRRESIEALSIEQTDWLLSNWFFYKERRLYLYQIHFIAPLNLIFFHILFNKNVLELC